MPTLKAPEQRVTLEYRNRTMEISNRILWKENDQKHLRKDKRQLN